MATGTELSVQFTGEIIQIFNRRSFNLLPGWIERFATGYGVLIPIRTLPSQLDVADHTGISVHDGGFYPFKLVAVASSARLLPGFGCRWIGGATHGCMTFHLITRIRISAVACCTIAMS